MIFVNSIVRSVSQGHSSSIPAQHLRGHAGLRQTHLSGAHQAAGSGGQLLGITWRGPGVRRDSIPHLVGYVDRGPEGRLPLLSSGSGSAAVRFLSCEPLLGPLELDLEGIHWVIVGGESGSNHRPMESSWTRTMREQCLRNSVPFFFKQWGGKTPKAGGRLLDGREWSEFPRAMTSVPAATPSVR